MTRAVSDGRYEVDPSLARPELGRPRERFVFELRYRDRTVTLVLREGLRHRGVHRPRPQGGPLGRRGGAARPAEARDGRARDVMPGGRGLRRRRVGRARGQHVAQRLAPGGRRVVGEPGAVQAAPGGDRREVLGLAVVLGDPGEDGVRVGGLSEDRGTLDDPATRAMGARQARDDTADGVVAGRLVLGRPGRAAMPARRLLAGRAAPRRCRRFVESVGRASVSAPSSTDHREVPDCSLRVRLFRRWDETVREVAVRRTAGGALREVASQER